MSNKLQEKYPCNPGDVFKDWTVVRFLKRNKHRQFLYLCVCKCGLEKILRKPELRSTTRYFSCQSCWAEKQFNLNSLVGKVFGETLVLSYVNEIKNKGTLYLVQCLRCKNIRKVQSYPLKNLKSKTCQSCANKERFLKESII